MTRRLTALTLVIALFGAVVLAPISALAQATNTFQDIPVTGTLPGGGKFVGTFDITQFVVQNGTLYAQGTLTGTLLNVAGQVINTLPPTTVLIPVSSITAARTCQVLFLELGPIDLQLLGLNVHINKITIRIDADPSQGILGQLLCAIAGGFAQGLLQQVANLLNQLLGLLG
jgi:hypothetical protein